MDTEYEILGLGVVLGWITTAFSMVIVGVIFNIGEFKLLIMVGISAGVLIGMCLIGMLISFFLNFKIVRRE